MNTASPSGRHHSAAFTTHAHVEHSHARRCNPMETREMLTHMRARRRNAGTDTHSRRQMNTNHLRHCLAVAHAPPPRACARRRTDPRVQMQSHTHKRPAHTQTRAHAYTCKRTPTRTRAQAVAPACAHTRVACTRYATNRHRAGTAQQCSPRVPAECLSIVTREQKESCNAQPSSPPVPPRVPLSAA
jgi:hypothetical protein